jgi:exodeoxyribonuclease VII small subunit
MSKKTDNVTLSLEEIFSAIDTLTKDMEKSGISLDESLKLYKQAVSLIDTAKEKLNATKAEINEIAKNSKYGEFSE